MNNTIIIKQHGITRSIEQSEPITLLQVDELLYEIDRQAGVDTEPVLPPISSETEE